MRRPDVPLQNDGHSTIASSHYDATTCHNEPTANVDLQRSTHFFACVKERPNAACRHLMHHDRVYSPACPRVSTPQPDTPRNDQMHLRLESVHFQRGSREAKPWPGAPGQMWPDALSVRSSLVSPPTPRHQTSTTIGLATVTSNHLSLPASSHKLRAMPPLNQWWLNAQAQSLVLRLVTEKHLLDFTNFTTLAQMCQMLTFLTSLCTKLSSLAWCSKC
jgi:hypothetical protein